MMKPVYILSASITSPQQHFEDPDFLDVPACSNSGSLYIKEPDYRKYINPVAIRRMSRFLKMGISTGMNALQKANVAQPDAIITGTGRGSMVDMEQFLLDMIHMQEESLTPTAFIQSTYNSVNGWLALQTKSTGYNQTYVSRGSSLELALFDAQLLLNETCDLQKVLVGCIDEITPEYVDVKRKIGYWKNPIVSNLDIYKHSETPGTIAGEGAAFFTLSNDALNSICSIKGIEILQNITTETILRVISKLLSQHNLRRADIDVVITGMNGSSQHQDIYDNVINTCSSHTTVANFKHLCGEYDTSTGFALWVTTELFQRGEVPDTLIHRKGSNNAIKTVLIVNHYILGNGSVILLEKS